jgi:hypothetical protein
MVWSRSLRVKQTIIDQWSGVKVPPAPELKKVKADPQTTAFPRSRVVALPTLAMANAD